MGKKSVKHRSGSSIAWYMGIIDTKTYREDGPSLIDLDGNYKKWSSKSGRFFRNGGPEYMDSMGHKYWSEGRVYVRIQSSL